MITVKWKDGRTTQAESWDGLTEALRRMRWNADLETDSELRAEIARRAYVWSGALVNPALPADRFWTNIAATGLLELEVS